MDKYMQIIPLKYQTIPELLLKKVFKSIAAVYNPFPLHIDQITSIPAYTYSRLVASNTSFPHGCTIMAWSRTA
jgi:hypothetical protein